MTKLIILTLFLVLIVLLGFNLYLLIRFYTKKEKVEKIWQQTAPGSTMELEPTDSLEILPLVDWYKARRRLKGEAGVSYLIRTDDNTILFDVGYNRQQKHPSPLLRNMEKLGVSLSDIDSIVISHNHSDHVGGWNWMRQDTFSLSNHHIELGKKRVYTPVPMTYPGLKPQCCAQPLAIAKGVATIGAIPNQLFLGGWIPEQALAVNVKDRGIVVITGCGHQTLPRIIARVSALFKEPIYGIVGGLHYPVTDSRVKTMGIPVQRYIGTGKLPWEPITLDDVQQDIDLLKKQNLKLIAVSPHDSCDASLDAFKDAFPQIFRPIRVGEKIIPGESA